MPIELRNWVLPQTQTQIVPLSLQPVGMHLWYFKFRIFDLTEVKVWNIEDLRQRVAEIYEVKNQSLCQKLNFFLSHFFDCFKKIILFVFSSFLCLLAERSFSKIVWSVKSSIQRNGSFSKKSIVLQKNVFKNCFLIKTSFVL